MSLRGFLHERWRTQVTLLASGCLEGPERERATAHLETCAECRREDYDRFAAVWLELHDERGADTIDARLHEERFDSATRTRRLHAAQVDELPDGAFILHDGAPKLVRCDDLLTWTPGGYTRREPRRRGKATLLTPPSLVELLRTGWESSVPVFHPTAG